MLRPGWQCFGQPSVCLGVCGDGVVLGSEACDDGNMQDGDGCNAACRLETGWQCFESEPSVCGPICGDGALVSDEPCDGETYSASDCYALGLGDGALTCSPECVFDLSACEVQADCGNLAVEYPEGCDGVNLAGETCESLGFATGELACLPNCSDFDLADCAGFCGDDAINSSEACDGANFGGDTCQSQGFYSGSLACQANCAALITTNCSGICGDGVINGGETCDIADLGGETCQDQGFYNGSLACSGTCASFSTSNCSGVCGDSIINGPEACDGGSLAGQACASQGWDLGTLACLASCAGFNESGCSNRCFTGGTILGVEAQDEWPTALTCNAGYTFVGRIRQQHWTTWRIYTFCLNGTAGGETNGCMGTSCTPPACQTAPIPMEDLGIFYDHSDFHADRNTRICVTDAVPGSGHMTTYHYATFGTACTPPPCNGNAISLGTLKDVWESVDTTVYRLCAEPDCRVSRLPDCQKCRRRALGKKALCIRGRCTAR